MHHFDGIYKERWRFSMAMLVYRRVTETTIFFQWMLFGTRLSNRKSWTCSTQKVFFEWFTVPAMMHSKFWISFFLRGWFLGEACKTSGGYISKLLQLTSNIGRWFSLAIGWFLGSMLNFRGVLLQGCTPSAFLWCCCFFLALAQPTVNTNHLGKHFLSTRWPCKEPEKETSFGGRGREVGWKLIEWYWVK